MSALLGGTASESGNLNGDDFNRSGPSHLSALDWKNPDHRRSVAACLTRGAYVLEKDRQRKRHGKESLASPWWEAFHFELLEKLVDDPDGTIFGAIYQFKHPHEESGGRSSHKDGRPPKYVVAFRGNIIAGEPDALVRELKLDLRFIQNGLHQTSRVEIGLKAVERTVAAAHGRGDVWLTGHSLGSAIAMLAGRFVAKTENMFLEAFLFNPPFFSAPVEKIRDKKLKQGIQVAGSFVTAGLALAVEGSSRRQKSRSEEFDALVNWKPCLFVNPADPTCSGYVGYFGRRKKMEELGFGSIEKLAARNSKWDLLMSAFGKGSSDPLHLIPSANLTVNSTPAQDFKSAHGLEQWWGQDSRMSSELYEY